jgi:hypothetical protein
VEKKLLSGHGEKEPSGAALAILSAELLPLEKLLRQNVHHARPHSWPKVLQASEHALFQHAHQMQIV